MSRAPQIPRTALALGWLGVLPFAAFLLLTVTGAVLDPGTAVTALVAYGAVILSFMGGAHWGLAIAPAGAGAMGRRLTVSVLPALAAFGLWFLPPAAALPGLAAVFAALLAYDIATARAGRAPAWYPALRIPLTGAVVACLLLAGLLGPA